MKALISAAGAALLCLTACKPAAERAAAVSNDLPKLSFEKYTLGNGLEVILSEDHRLPVVAVNLWYHVGPANERPGRTGFAHLFEHMMNQGSKHVSSDQQTRILEAAGGTDINASTSFDATNYFETVPANQLETALWIESDRMGFLLDMLDQQQLTGQIDVVRNERRQTTENAPYGLVEEAVYHQLFPRSHPYHAAVIGSHADIEAARLEDVREFFKEYYAPNNASLAIVGDFDKAAVKALVEKYFGPLARGKDVAKTQVTTPAITAERRVTVTDKVELPRLYMAWLTPPIYAPGDADADLLAILLGGGKSSRLYKKLVYEQQIAQDVSASQYSLSLASVFTIQATARPGRTLAEIEQSIDAELAKLRAEGPTEVELTRARNRVETDIISGLERLGGNGGVADRLNQYNHHRGDPGYLIADIERYRKADVASIRALAQSLASEHRVVVQGVPGPKVLEDVPRRPVRAAPAARSEKPVTRDSDWRAQQPVAGAAPALRLPVPAELKLGNGLRVLLLERHELPLVAASLVVLHGSEANSAALPGLAAFTADMLDEGTKQRGALQLADDVALLGAHLSTAASSDVISVNVGSLRKNADSALALLADVALNPAFSDAEMERVRAKRQTSLLQQNDQPETVAARVFYRELYGASHPYGFLELGTVESLKAIRRGDLARFWQGGFAPGNAALVVSGDITAAQLQALAEKHFGQWSGTAAAVKLPEVGGRPGRSVLVVDKPGAPQTALRIGQVGVPRSNPDYVPLEVMNNALGWLFSSRINMNLRERHGYTYGAYSWFSFRRGPGPFSVSTSVRTNATADSVREVFNEFAGMRDRPLSAEELRTARESMSRSLPAEFASNDAAASSAAYIHVYGLPLDYYSRLPSLIDAVTAADVQRVARQYLQLDRMTVVAVGDRAQIAPGLSALGLGRAELRDGEGRPLSANR